MKECADAGQIVRIFSHELAHQFLRNMLHMRGQEKSSGRSVLEELSSGYMNFREGVFLHVNEAITEMISIEILEHLRKTKGVDFITGLPVAYNASIILFDMLIEETSKRLKRDANEIRGKLYEGYFKGKVAVLKAFNDAFGKDALKLLAGLKGVVYPEKILLGIAGYFGLDQREFQKRMQRYESGEEINILGGIKIRQEIKDQKAKWKILQ